MNTYKKFNAGYASYFKGFLQYRYLLKVLVQKDFKKKYKDSTLGVMWSLFNPLLQMAVLTVIFSTIFASRIPNFPLYMISGKIVFDFFSSGTNASIKSITGAESIIKKIYLPKYLLTISKVMAAFINSLFSMIALALVMFFTKAEVSVYLIFVPVYLILELVFAVGVGFVLATVATFFRDIEYLYGVVIVILTYFSAIFYPAEIIPDRFRILLNFNPVYLFISGFRAPVCYASMPSLFNLVLCALISLIALCVGVVVFEKNQDKFIQHI